MLRISPSRPSRLLGKLLAIGLLWVGLIAGFGDTAYAQTTPAPQPPPAPAAPPPSPAAPTAPDAAPPAPPMAPSALWVPAPPPPPLGAPDITVKEWHDKWYEQQRKTHPDLPPPPPFPAGQADMKLSEWQLMKKKDRLQSILDKPAPFTNSAELTSYQNPGVYGIWLNGKRIENAVLVGYQPEQLRRIFQSTLKKNAVHYGQYTYHLELMTEDYYQRELEKFREEIDKLER